MTVSRINMAEDGPEICRLPLGVWRLTDWGMSTAELRRYVDACLALGITTYDHADIYGDYACEAEFGKLLAADSTLRDQIEIITKCDIILRSEKFPEHRVHAYDTSKEHIITSAERSLRLLNTDYLDVLLLHRPDALMDADEVAEAFTELKQAGKVLHFGVSNFKPWQFDLLASRLDFPLVTNQVELSVLAMDVIHDGTLDQCQQQRIAPMAWSPFAGGRLFREESEQAIRLRETMHALCAELGAGVTLDQLALAWILRHPANVIPILGSGKIERIRTAVGAEAISLTRQQWYMIWEASMGHEVP